MTKRHLLQIQVKLEKYQTLRAEILFHMQNKTHIILLGLTVSSPGCTK